MLLKEDISSFMKHTRSVINVNRLIEKKLMCVRLAAIDGVGGNTGVKPQHPLRHLPTASLAPSLTIILIFFYSNKNHLVQLEDTTIKTERGCSMQHIERTTVTSQIRFILSHVRRVSRADWREEWGETDKTMPEEFQNKM